MATATASKQVVRLQERLATAEAHSKELLKAKEAAQRAADAAYSKWDAADDKVIELRDQINQAEAPEPYTPRGC